MPKRTNAFQELIHLLYKELNNDLDIESSEMRTHNLTGKLREVDTILKGRIPGVGEIIVGVECVSRGRKATQEWVEQIREKHNRLGIHKTVLVAERGFYKAAWELAEKYKMQPISLADEELMVNSKLVEQFKEFFLERRELVIKAYEFMIPNVVYPNGEPAESPSWETVLYGEDGTPLGSLQESMNSIIPHVILRVAELVKDEIARYVTAYLEPRQRVCDRLAQGNNREILAVSIHDVFKRTVAGPVQLKFRSVEEAQLAYGEITESPFKEYKRVTVGLVESIGKPVRGAVYIESSEKPKFTIKELTLHHGGENKDTWQVGHVDIGPPMDEHIALNS